MTLGDSFSLLFISIYLLYDGWFAAARQISCIRYSFKVVYILLFICDISNCVHIAGEKLIIGWVISNVMN